MSRPSQAARGVILPVVLVLIGLLSLMTAGYIFFVRAEMTGTIAHRDSQQARLAAESGLEEFVARLRIRYEDGSSGRDDASLWFNSPEVFRHMLVWADRYLREEDPVREMGSRTQLREDGELTPAWRASIVADSHSNESNTMRYGATPESAKLNINFASDQQIETLLNGILAGLQIENPQELINAFLDWRDTDEETRDGGAENEYYNTLEPAYMAKNGPFDTVEEILLIKGFNAAILYGEDVNRNGILDPNEDDGEDSFPEYDNGDGILDRGIAPYVTIWTREPDTSLDNKPRINLNADVVIVETMMAQNIPEGLLSDESLQYILNQKRNNFNFSGWASPAELYTGDDDSAGGNGNPITLEEMPVIMDRFSTRALDQAAAPLAGLININAAPLRVLTLIPNMTDEAAQAIIDNRGTLEPEAHRTTAWLLTAEVLEPALFKQIAPYITTKAYQFHVEILGYADHIKMVRRYEWIIEMAGPLPQVKYHRDLTSFGPAWPIDDDNFVITMGG